MMNEDDKLHIIIDSFTGSASGADLKGCYFKLKSNGTYDFYDKDGREKCRDLRISSGCSFFLDERPNISWTISLNPPCSDRVVNGEWGNNLKGDVGEEGGTFQGQAGGTEDASAASASAS